jgi:hypothetical protein
LGQKNSQARAIGNYSTPGIKNRGFGIVAKSLWLHLVLSNKNNPAGET